MIIPLTTTGFWYDAVEVKPDEWRIVVRIAHGDQFFDSAIYPKSVCERVVNQLNANILVRRSNNG